MPLHFTSFRARILAFVAGLLVVVQGAVLIAVNAANLREARRHIDEALQLTASAFGRSIRAREQILVEKARLLSADFAFKQAVASRDHPTILSALENHRARVGADVMVLLGPSGEVLADTLHADAHGTPSVLLPLLRAAMQDEFGEASSIRFVDGVAYQLVAVPLFTPEPSAWVAIGFAVRDDFARELEKETRTHVSLLRREDGSWSAFCSTLPQPTRDALERGLADPVRTNREIVTLVLGGDEFVSWIAPLSELESSLVVVLQRSLEDELRPFLRLRRDLLAILALGLGLSGIGGVLLASRVTKPVADLVRGARRIREGNYSEPVAVAQRDELGVLGASFNDMMRGLAERDRVRDMLGRVVAPQIAEELLGREIELGGEERTVTVLFADIQGFTGLSEREDPQRLVRILNAFLSGVSAAIEAHGGVVEEYMGDGAKALFGAPMRHDDDAQHAVFAALELQASLPRIEAEIARFGGRPLEIAIGINTAPVVAGRMGSLSRLKYTVVGDGVNLASRLEGLCRRYGVGIVVSESTRESCRSLVFRELDRVRVSGRQAPVTIYEPLGERGALSAALLDALDRYHEALRCLRARNWDEARARFEALSRHEPQTRLFRVHLERIEGLRAQPPAADWDGTIGYDEK